MKSSLFVLLILTIIVRPAFSQAPKVIPQTPHGDFIHEIAFADNLSYFATGSSDGEVKIFDMASKKQLASLREFNDAMGVLDFSSDGHTILIKQESYTNDSTILWNWLEGTMEKRYNGAYVSYRREGRVVEYDGDGYGAFRQLSLKDEKGKVIDSIRFDKELFKIRHFAKGEKGYIAVLNQTHFLLYDDRNLELLLSHDYGDKFLRTTIHDGFNIDMDRNQLLVYGEQFVKVYDLGSKEIIRHFTFKSTKKVSESVNCADISDGRLAISVLKNQYTEDYFLIIDIASGEEIYHSTEFTPLLFRQIPGSREILTNQEGFPQIFNWSIDQLFYLSPPCRSGYVCDPNQIGIIADTVLMATTFQRMQLTELEWLKQVEVTVETDSQYYHYSSFGSPNQTVLDFDWNVMISYDYDLGRLFEEPRFNMKVYNFGDQTSRLLSIPESNKANFFDATLEAYHPRWALFNDHQARGVYDKKNFKLKGHNSMILIDSAGRIVDTWKKGFEQYAFSPSGNYLCFGKGRKVKIKDLSGGKDFEINVEGEDSYKPDVEQVLFINDQLLAVENLSDVKLVNLNSRQVLQTYELYPSHFRSWKYDEGKNNLLIGTDDGKVMIIDLETREIESYPVFKNSIDEMTISRKYNLLVVFSRDEQHTAFMNRDDMTLKVRLSHGVFFTDDGYYTSSREGLAYMGFRLKDRVYGYEAFDLRYNRPDKVITALNPFSPAIEPLRLLAEKRLKFEGVDPTDQTAAVPPVTTIHTKQESAVTEREFNLSFSFESEQSDIAQYNVLVNGIPVFGSEGKSIDTYQNGKVLTEMIILSEGMNNLQVFAESNSGLRSLYEPLTVNYVPEEPASRNLYIITIGNSQYSDPDYSLTYAAKDGRDVIETFQTSKDETWQVHVDTLFNQDVTRSNVLKLKEKLLGSQVDDQVILFLAGHGLLDNSYEFYYGTYDVDFNNPADKGLRYTEIEWLLDGIPARKKLILIDACHSGEVDLESIEQTQVDAPGSDGEITFRGFKRYKNQSDQIGLPSSFELMKELFNGLQNNTGTQVISAAGGVEVALESAKWKNGVFTYALREGLIEHKADLDKNRVIMVSELQKYIFRRVKELTNGVQNPTARQENLSNDFVILTYSNRLGTFD